MDEFDTNIVQTSELNSSDVTLEAVPHGSFLISTRANGNLTTMVDCRLRRGFSRPEAAHSSTSSASKLQDNKIPYSVRPTAQPLTPCKTL